MMVFIGIVFKNGKKLNQCYTFLGATFNYKFNSMSYKWSLSP